MIIKAIETERFQDYKVPVMYIAFPNCTFKCEKECGKKMCQNSPLSSLPDIDVNCDSLIKKYLSNPITKAIVCGGLEPMDSFNTLESFVNILRNTFDCDDTVVIYTGYTEEECISQGWIDVLKNYANIVIKFGRYKPNQNPHYDDILGVNLASNNQYAKRL